MSKRTYKESARLVGYFNYRYSVLIRSLAYDRGISISDALVMMARDFISAVPESEQKRMTDNYIKDLKIGEG